MTAEIKPGEHGNRAAAIALGGVLCYLLFFSQLGALGFIGPDEPRYAQVAKEMAEHGDWITPRLYGVPWFEKPILYYWLAAVAYKIGGVNETMARLPSALAATLTVIVLSALAWKLYGWTAAELAFLFTAGSLGWLGFARAASTDMLFSACLNLVLACLLLIETASEAATRSLSAYGFYAALGLAVLAKGPAALVLAGGTAVIYFALARRREFLTALFEPGSIALLLLVAAPWYALVTLVNGGSFVQTFLISHNIERFLTPVFQHERGLWFFFVVLPLAIFPWTLLLGLPLVRLRGERSRLRLAPSPELLLVVWIAVPLVFFSLSRSKLPGYILPAVPALCLLLAREHSSPRGGEASRGFPLAATASAFLAAATSPWILEKVGLPITDARAYRMELALVLVALCGIGWLAWKRRGVAWALALAVLIALAVNATLFALAGEINRYVSARPMAQRILMVAPRALPEISTFQLSRQFTYGLDFYLGRALPDAEYEPLRGEVAYVLVPSAKLAQAQSVLALRLEVIGQIEGEVVLARAIKALPVAAPSRKN